MTHLVLESDLAQKIFDKMLRIVDHGPDGSRVPGWTAMNLDGGGYREWREGICGGPYEFKVIREIKNGLTTMNVYYDDKTLIFSYFANKTLLGCRISNNEADDLITGILLFC